MLYYERKFKRKGYQLLIGIDEVGRGPLAGPVVAVAVSLKDYCFRNRIADSKQLSPLQRERAYVEIVRKSIFGIGIVNEKIIDRINILQATRLAMQEAVFSLLSNGSALLTIGTERICRSAKLEKKQKPRCFCLVDGQVKLDIEFPYLNIIRGDSRSMSIACASILAKVIRDRIMSLYEAMYPQYGFLQHKGYPTLLHRSALTQYGPCLIHRMSFCGVQGKS